MRMIANFRGALSQRMDSGTRAELRTSNSGVSVKKCIGSRWKLDPTIDWARMSVAKRAQRLLVLTSDDSAERTACVVQRSTRTSP